MECGVTHHGSCGDTLYGEVVLFDKANDAVLMRAKEGAPLTNQDSTIEDLRIFAQYNISDKDFKFIPIKPIDTRTDKEKAIDDLFDIMNATPFKVKEQAELMLDRIINGKVFGVSFTGSKS